MPQHVVNNIGTDVAYAAALLRAGRLVAIPTETVYGLAANGLDADAVLKIYEAKNRPSFNPLILHVGSLEGAEKLVDGFPATARRLAEAFWPGPLTLVLKKKESVPDVVTAGMDTVAIRMPHHPLTLQLLRMLNFPLAAPSANPSGYVSPTSAGHVLQQLGSKVDYVLDGGPCEIGIESTIIKVTPEATILLRPGGLELEKIEQLAGPVQTVASAAPVEAPGMMSTHYAPVKKLILGDIKENLKNFLPQQTGILAFRSPVEAAGVAAQCVLSPAGDLKEAAKNLFSYLRQLDQADITVILAEPVPDIGLGRAINDRLRRAASQHTAA
ncbi:MAG: threonylcarbamoyl-AMP synthase [Chitinophagales bacterium]|nr:MAG: threonylcarbamoyl-AMP synthase [Chitinophagales bacterium]